jgi:dihydrofolate synthase/folylpolyglutamate synthase
MSLLTELVRFWIWNYKYTAPTVLVVMTTYPEAIQFLYGLQLFGTHFGLERAEKLAALAGNPEKKLRFIHVAGTNGKGSTCAMLESIYRTAGLRVGLFTSPHLVSFRERIQIDRQLISQDDLIRLVAEVQPLLKQFPADNHPTMFEVVTVMALKYFAEKKCDLVIWETGLGGRLDATNIVTPLASVITNIAFDHMQWLGDTLVKIAAEKAGIIKPGIPVVATENKTEAFGVIESVARERGAELMAVAADANPPPSERFAAFCRDAATLRLLGAHQKVNAALALATVGVLQKQIPISQEQIEIGLRNVDWPGRLQLVERGRQKILLDGAHNVAGAETLRTALRNDFGRTRPVFIFGALADKNWPDICKIFAPLAAKIFTVPVASTRTADAGEIAEVFRQENPAAEVVACKNFSEAIIASKDEPFLVVTGSLYLVGEALEKLGGLPSDGGERGLNEWSAAR